MESFYVVPRTFDGCAAQMPMCNSSSVHCMYNDYLCDKHIRLGISIENTYGVRSALHTYNIYIHSMRIVS